jgi:thiosulfate dehydrogenase [quinone] large subunit
VRAPPLVREVGVNLNCRFVARWAFVVTGARHPDRSRLPTGSSNPLTDSHFIHAIVLVVLAFTHAGTTWGLGRPWARLPFVHQHRWAQ